MQRPLIAVSAAAGLGGTEKAATYYAAELARRGYRVDYFAKEGPRSAYLRANGVRLVTDDRNETNLYHYLCSARPAVIHQHVPGYPIGNPIYPALRRIDPGERPKLIETNVFGRFEDSESDSLVDFRMFISSASAAQAFARAHIAPTKNQLRRHTVLYYPVAKPGNSVATISPEQRKDIRKQIAVKEDEVLLIRIGQPGHKWTSWECQAFQMARRSTPDISLRLFLMEPPKKLRAEIEAGRFGAGIILREQTADFEWLEKLYASAELMIHASDWGESFGYTIAEAMAAGLPVITRSTPWGDNAQVELVKNGETGFVCWSVPEMGRRIAELANNKTKRHEMGSAAGQRILSLANPENEADLLEEVIACTLENKWSETLEARNARLLDFIDTFQALERGTSETLSDHPIDFVGASLYACYRKSRAKVRSDLNRWQRGQMRRKTIS